MREDVYKKLAATGKYYNTGKVLIGVQHVPVKKYVMSRDEERLQSVLLGQRIPCLEFHLTVYMLYAMGVVCLVAAIAKAFS